MHDPATQGDAADRLPRIDAAPATGWRTDEPGRPPFVLNGYPFLDPTTDAERGQT